MPTYDYRCEANGRVVEVSHRMSEEIQNWGELCSKAGIEAGDTPAESPVKRLATGGNVITGGVGGDPVPPCATGGGCPGGSCGIG
ncbi:MAG: regulator [Candidatus Thiodiazotropha sp. (ex Ctena orbiculata)]|nr:regulator [Candidatus Thiodiazotropha taylori]